MAALKKQCKFTQHSSICINYSEAHRQQYDHPIRKPCNYANECTSRITKHHHEYSHPGDKDWPIIPTPRIPCRDAEYCSIYHIPLHRLRFSHPKDKDWSKPALPMEPSSTKGKYHMGDYVALQSFQFGYVIYVEEKPDGFYYHVDINEEKPLVVKEDQIRLQETKWRWSSRKRWVALLDKSIDQTIKTIKTDNLDPTLDNEVVKMFFSMHPDLIKAVIKNMGSKKRNTRKSTRRCYKNE